MSQSFTQNLHIKILALLAAVTFWFGVLSYQNTFFVLPETVAVESFNTPDGLAVVNPLEPVEVTVRADQEDFKTLTAQDFTAYVDLQGLAVGEHELEVVVTADRSEVGVVDVQPVQIQVVLEEVTTQDVPLEVSLTGVPDDRYTATVSASTRTVTLKGAPSALESVDQAVAVVSLSGNEMQGFSQSIEVIVQDKWGRTIPQVTAEPSSVEVHVELVLEEVQKSVGVKVNLEGLDDVWIQAITTDPNVIYIQGEVEAIDAIDYLETETVYVDDYPTDEETTVESTATLVLPEGVTLASGEPGTIQVSFAIAPLEEETPPEEDEEGEEE